MKQLLFVVWDSQTECVVGPVITVRHQLEAVRAFTALILDKNTTPGLYPQHFKLLKVGTLDDAHPSIEGAPSVIVITGEDVINQQTENK